MHPALAAELLSIDTDDGEEVIRLALADTSPHKVFTVDNPLRLVIDVPSLEQKPRLSLPSSYDGRLIKAVRFGQFDPETSRFVFELTRPVRIGDVSEDKKGRLEVTIAAGTPDKKSAQKNNPPAKKGKKGKPLIVIDAGHGGVDPGTIGPHNSYEKYLTLDYAKTLKTRLQNSGYKVKLTRDDDRFIMLRQRVAIARKAGAVLFISLHADSAPDGAARGLSVYTVSEQASDREAEALAAQENKADVLAGVNLSEEHEDVADILISLAQRETMNRSATLADQLVMALDGKVRLLQNSHRFAGFAVLKAPDIPSVLIEIGFLSHPQEEQLLKSKAYREKVTAGIVAGVDAYFRQQREMER